MLSSKLQTLLLSIVLVFTTALSLYGQSTYGTVDGTVMDPSGAAVAGADVTLTNTGTQEKHTQATGGTGAYSFVNVIPGNYRLDITKPGFKHFARTNVVVQVQQETHIDANLTVGQVSESVEVTAETPLLQAETSSLGQVVEERKANELPLNGRNIFNLITVSPAAVAQGGSGGSPVGQNPFSWGNYQVGGSFANQGAEYLDGQPLNIGYINLPIIIPTQDSIGEYKVQYNNQGAEWGKFSGGLVNLSTKSGTNNWHGSAYEYFRARVLNANEYFNKNFELSQGEPNKQPPWTQNQYGFQLGGPVIKNKTFFYTSWEQYRQRTGSPFTTTVPSANMLNGDFSAVCTAPVAQGGQAGTFNAAGICSVPAGQIYDPYTVNQISGNRTPYGLDAGNPTCPGNCIPSAEFNQATTVMWKKYFPAANVAGAVVSNYVSAAPAGGNTNEFVARGDQNIGANTRLFGRFAYFGLTDLAVNPFGTGLCLDRCAELYHSKLLALDLNHTFTPTTILDVNLAGSRFVYGRNPLLAGYDLTQLGWTAAYNSAPASMRTPPSPAFPFPNDVGKSQGNSAIGDHNTQYNFSPALTMIRGKHTIQAGFQWELGLDNYFQTNIASGAFAFGGQWTNSIGGPNCVPPPVGTCTGGFAFSDFLLGLSKNQGTFVNQTEGSAQVPAQTAGKQAYRALYVDDTFRTTNKLTLNLGLRYELQGTWSERFNRLTFWNPTATNATVTGCPNGCIGDASYVGSGGNNIPMDKKAFSPRVGFAYALDSKTVIRGGYGIFFIPNYVSFGLNPDNDVVNLATTPFLATKDSYTTPFATMNGYQCSQSLSVQNFSGFSCADLSGPFGVNGILLPPGRNAQPNLSAFVVANGSPNLAPHANPKYGYVEQYNIDIQRQLPAGFFADVAYAGSHGVHLEQYNTDINQIPDSFLSQQAALTTLVTNPLGCPTSPATCPNPALAGTMIAQGQLDRPYPQYNNIALAGYGCCSSSYNSLQATVTRRFAGGGTMLVAYTNSKLMTNTDTLTSWLEGSTGGVGSVQDWNNLKGERSLSSQDVSQRLVISYVLDLPFGKGKMFANGFSGAANKLVSGWGINGITTFQRGFPLKITYANSTPLEAANLGVSNVRPDVVAGCDKSSAGGHITQWFNTSCFAAPPDWGFGSESRVDGQLRGPGINNWDFAIFKRTTVTERVGLEFRTEFFNLFNHPYFGMPATSYAGSPTANGFGAVTSTVGAGAASPERLIQFALKLVF
ncbi:MAG TPA: TonB-dependent receptor [Terriglobales bacterium]|nr:TonB-dependent receptor [Terriglobales bacterium]